MSILYEYGDVRIDGHFAKFGEKFILISAIVSVDVADQDQYRARGGCIALVAAGFALIALTNIGYSEDNVVAVGFSAILAAAVSAYMYSRGEYSTKIVTIRTGSVFATHVFASQSGRTFVR